MNPEHLTGIIQATAAIGAGLLVGYVIAYLKAQQCIEKMRKDFDEYWDTLKQQRDAAFDQGRTMALNESRLLMKSKEKEMRADSIKKSKAVMIGKLAEQFAPYLPGWEYNPTDARFLGSPIDFIVFDGMADGAIKEIVLVEIKTGNSRLSARERDLQDVVLFKRIRHEVIRV